MSLFLVKKRPSKDACAGCLSQTLTWSEYLHGTLPDCRACCQMAIEILSFWDIYRRYERRDDESMLSIPPLISRSPTSYFPFHHCCLIGGGQVDHNSCSDCGNGFAVGCRKRGGANTRCMPRKVDMRFSTTNH